MAMPKQPRPISDAYAHLPRRVVQSEAYRALPDWAVRVLVAMACQYNGSNNGELQLTSNNFKRLGVRAMWHADAGIALLEVVGLLKRTRDAGRPPRGSSLYALSWLVKDWPVPSVDSTGVDQQPGNEWAEWETPSGWSNIVRDTKLAAKARLSSTIEASAPIALQRRAVSEAQDGSPWPSTAATRTKRAVRMGAHA